MGWKNVKDHYRIEHLVQVRDGRICIGSYYVHDLIRVTFDGKVSWGNLGPSNNADLERYYSEMTADLDKLEQLIDQPDTFSAHLQVFTYDGGNIIEKRCEAIGWPNVTHDGLLMYNNTFSIDKEKVVQWAKRDADYGIRSAMDSITATEAKLQKQHERLAREKADRAKLEADYPTVT